MLVSIDVAKQLKEILERHGREVVQEPKRLEGLLRDYCGGQKREINLLLRALEENVPASLEAAQKGNRPREIVLSNLKGRLARDHGMALEAAAWSVDAWDYALGFRAAEVPTPEKPKANGSASQTRPAVPEAKPTPEPKDDQIVLPPLTPMIERIRGQW